MGSESMNMFVFRAHDNIYKQHNAKVYVLPDSVLRSGENARRLVPEYHELDNMTVSWSCSS